MRIGIDLDDTIWKFHEKFFEFYNEKYGTNYSIEEYKIYNMDIFLGLSEIETANLFNEYESLEKYKKLPFLDLVRESLLELDKEHDIYFITARSDFTKDLVKERLFDVFNREMPVYFQYDNDRNKLWDKADFCIENKIEIMIDDGYHNLVKCSNNGIKCFLISYAWNKEKELNENIVRVNNWEEIMEKIKK